MRLPLRFSIFFSLLVYFSTRVCLSFPLQNQIDQSEELKNKNYDDRVGIVQWYPIIGGVEQKLASSIMELGSSQKLKLLFDWLSPDFENFNISIIHCGIDWKKSNLIQIQYYDTFLDNFSYDNSFDTHTQYIQYSTEIPCPKISGNYVLSVNKMDDPEEIIFSRRFVVIENRCSISANVTRSSNVSMLRTNQQIEFGLSYQGLEIYNPLQNISVVIVQNKNWQNTIKNLKPTLIRSNESYLEYKSIRGDNNFWGWNEYRFLDTRRVIFDNTQEVFVQSPLDVSKEHLPYTLPYRDINGQFVIGDDNPLSPFSSLDYLWTNVRINTEEFVNHSLYVLGSFNNWEISPKSKMIYNYSLGFYEIPLFLKQGYYEYLYYLMSPKKPPFLLEGSFFDTENEYEIFVYYKSPQWFHYQIIGYKYFKSFP